MMSIMLQGGSPVVRAVLRAPASGRAALRCVARLHDAWRAPAPPAAPLLLREDAPRPASVTRGDIGTYPVTLLPLNTNIKTEGSLMKSI